eukprot:scaffold9117_cov92-Isochrysis_galbana.AAC.2
MGVLLGRCFRGCAECRKILVQVPSPAPVGLRRASQGPFLFWLLRSCCGWAECVLLPPPFASPPQMVGNEGTIGTSPITLRLSSDCRPKIDLLVSAESENKTEQFHSNCRRSAPGSTAAIPMGGGRKCGRAQRPSCLRRPRLTASRRESDHVGTREATGRVQHLLSTVTAPPMVRPRRHCSDAKLAAQEALAKRAAVLQQNISGIAGPAAASGLPSAPKPPMVTLDAQGRLLDERGKEIRAGGAGSHASIQLNQVARSNPLLSAAAQ